MSRAFSVVSLLEEQYEIMAERRIKPKTPDAFMTDLQNYRRKLLDEMFDEYDLTGTTYANMTIDSIIDMILVGFYPNRYPLVEVKIISPPLVIWDLLSKRIIDYAEKSGWWAVPSDRLNSTRLAFLPNPYIDSDQRIDIPDTLFHATDRKTAGKVERGKPLQPQTNSVIKSYNNLLFLSQESGIALDVASITRGQPRENLVLYRVDKSELRPNAKFWKDPTTQWGVYTTTAIPSKALIKITTEN